MELIERELVPGSAAGGCGGVRAALLVTGFYADSSPTRA